MSVELALVGTTLALAASTVAAAVSGADPASTGNDLAPWVQGGAGGAAVAGLVYFARLVVKGELVAKPTAEQQAEINAALRATGERETRYVLLLEEGQRREDALGKQLADATRALWEHERSHPPHPDHDQREPR